MFLPGDEVALVFRVSRHQQWASVPPDLRIRRLLKYAARAVGLECVRVEDLECSADVSAYTGWLLLATGWVQVCCAFSREECERLLQERQREDVRGRQVLRRGEKP